LRHIVTLSWIQRFSGFTGKTNTAILQSPCHRCRRRRELPCLAPNQDNYLFEIRYLRLGDSIIWMIALSPLMFHTAFQMYF
jgi:hypothetical protein